MKKVLVTMLMAFALVGCSNKKFPELYEPTKYNLIVNAEGREADMSEYENLKSNENFVSITAQELFDAIGDGETDSVIYIGSPYCSHCQEAAPTLQETAKAANQNVYYINLPNVSNEEYQKLIEELSPILNSITDENGEQKKEIFIPHVFTLKDGEYSSENSIIGYSEGTTYDSLFTALG